MVERFLPSDDPIKEQVLEWTVSRDARDAGRLLEWLEQTRTLREKRAMVALIEELLGELKLAIEELAELQ